MACACVLSFSAFSGYTSLSRVVRLVNVECSVAENEGPCYQERHGGAAVVNLYTPLVTCDKIKQIAAHYSTRIVNSSVL